MCTVWLPPGVNTIAVNKYIVYHTIYTGCHRRNEPNFGRVFLMLNYTDITQNTYVQSWTVSEIMASEVWNFDSCYTLIDYQIHIKAGRNMLFFVMLISVLNIKVTCEWHKAINLNCKVPRNRVKVIHRVRSTIHHTGMLSGDVTRLVWLPACLPAWHAGICISGERQRN